MRKLRKRKKRHGFLRVGIALLAVFLVFVAVKNFPSDTVSSLLGGLPAGAKTATLDNGWNLILINRKNYIPEDYKFELTELSNGQKVDSRIYPALQQMFDDARAAGLHLFVGAGYRTAEYQQQLLDEKTEAYENEGHSPSEARKLAEAWVALPGTSEHQIGIAVDINADKDYNSSDEVYNWLAENAFRYGFIKRYPSDKTSITGVINEPWHYRYVGKEAAGEIHAQGICLEEYLGEA